MKNSKLFQYIVMGAFVFFIIVGAIMFATYRSADKTAVNINIKMWGTLPSDSFIPFFSRYFSNAGLKYTVNYTAKDPGTFNQDLLEALASGTGPDAVILPEDLIVSYSNKIYPIPYTVLPALTFSQTFIQEGELYENSAGVLALPFYVDPLVMYWNRDIFNNSSVTKPPAAWAEISNLALKLTKKDPASNISESTVALGEFRNVTDAKEILSALLIQAGSLIVNLNSDGSLSSALKDNLGLKNSPATLALEFYTNFSNPVKTTYSWNRSLPQSLDAFTNGDLAIYFGLASEYTKIKNKNPNLNFGVSLLPQTADAKVRSTFGHMMGFAIMKNSSDPSGAYTVITALASAEAVPFWKDIFNLPSARRDILGQTETNAVKTVFNQSAIISKGWLDPNAVGTSAIFQEMVESYTTGQNTLEQAVSTASDKLDNLLVNN